MAFSYDADIGSDRDRVRLLIGDTSSTAYSYEDGEIDGLLTLWGGDIQLAAAQALRILAADRAKLAIRYKVNGFELDRTQVAAQLLKAADAIEKAAGSAPFELESVLEDDVDSAGIDRSNYVNGYPFP